MKCVFPLAIISVLAVLAIILRQTSVEARSKNYESMQAASPGVLARMNIENWRRVQRDQGPQCRQMGGYCNKSCTGSTENPHWQCKGQRKKCCVYVH
uniref:Putative carboxypeptidase inhibitor n=1 Tax=Rhipicephalus pulchellus TaxID=72859 RepID=L7MCF0_RHIPC